MIVPIKNLTERKRIENITQQLKVEINIKEVELLDDANSLLVKEIKPNFKILGPRFGKDLKEVNQAIKKLSAEQIQQLEKHKSLKIDIDGKTIKLEYTDVEVFFKDIEGWQIAQSEGLYCSIGYDINSRTCKRRFGKGTC